MYIFTPILKNTIEIYGAEVPDVCSDEIFFFFIALLCLHFNNSRCKTR